MVAPARIAAAAQIDQSYSLGGTSVDRSFRGPVLVYVADVDDTNLLLVVVDGPPRSVTTLNTTHRQVVA